jgi:hypothetical protein
MEETLDDICILLDDTTELENKIIRLITTAREHVIACDVISLELGYTKDVILECVQNSSHLKVVKKLNKTLGEVFITVTSESS